MDQPTREEISAHLNDLLKPPGSLARLEDLAADLCRIQKTLRPQTKPRRVVLFAGDHGVVDEGVSAWPSSVTATMVRSIRSGNSASAVLARTSDTQLVLIDVGTLDSAAGETTPGDPASGDSASADSAQGASNSPPQPTGAIRFESARVRGGARNLAREPALTADEFTAAFAIGERAASDAARDGIRLIAAGEMGIGNTTAASCLAVHLAHVPVEHAVGRGAGVNEKGLARKIEVVTQAVARSASPGTSPLEAIAGISGLEHAAMAGLFVGAHRSGLTVVLDGFVASSSALIAEQLHPGTVASMIAAHESSEPGHASVLNRLGLRPALQWDMRLGEGTGALLLMPLLDAAAAMVGQMGTFSEAGLGPAAP